MKRFNKALIIALTSTMLFACDDIVARPGTILDNDNLVNFGDSKNDYYGNDFEGIYDQMISAGTSNETIFDAIVTEIAKSEVSKFYNLTKEQFETVLTNVTNGLAGREKVSYDASISESATKIENIITEHVKDALVDIAKGDSYNVDYLFQEEKVTAACYGQNFILKPLSICKNDLYVSNLSRDRSKSPAVFAMTCNPTLHVEMGCISLSLCNYKKNC